MSTTMFTRDPDLCVITCAVTGVLANRKPCGVAARMVRDCGRKVATVAEARQILGLGQFKPQAKVATPSSVATA